jgi:hypothetical protein
MTGVTGIVNRGADQLKIVVAIVRVMTVSTGHFPKTKWVTAASESLSTGSGVTGKTHILLCQVIQYRILFYVYCMATDAGNCFFLVHASLPGQGDAVGVTRQANFILYFHRVIGVE